MKKRRIKKKIPWDLWESQGGLKALSSIEIMGVCGHHDRRALNQSKFLRTWPESKGDTSSPLCSNRVLK